MAQTDSNPSKHPTNGARGPSGGASAHPSTGISPSIGFNELRQACEISALREDLARLAGEVEDFRDHVEEGVGAVRSRVAELRAEELADPDVMGALLQFAVGTLIGIRERVRVIDSTPNALDDDARSGWDVTRATARREAEAPERFPSPADTPKSAPPPSPPSITPRAVTSARVATSDRPPPPPPFPLTPSPRPLTAHPPAPTITDAPFPPPRPADRRPADRKTDDRKTDDRTMGTRGEARVVNHHAVDWLGPARR